MRKISFLIIITFFILIGSSYNNYLVDSKGEEDPIIRFHIKAHSDSPQDQDLKYKIRDGVLVKFQDKFAVSSSIEETRRLIRENIPLIEAYTQDLIKDEGQDLSVVVNLENRHFPTRKYGEKVYPKGDYETLQITLGEGQGKNWWCVMFPPLCIVDLFSRDFDLPRTEIRTEKDEEAKPPIIIRSKIVEVISKRINKLHHISNTIE